MAINSDSGVELDLNFSKVESTSPQLKWYEVAVEAPIPHTLTYYGQAQRFCLGQTVLVSLGRRKVRGVIVNVLQQKPQVEFELKSILDVDEEIPALTEDRLRWLKWLSQYYLHPIGQVMSLTFPPLKKKGARASRKGPIVKEVNEITPPILTAEQIHVVQNIRSHPGFGTHLLFGVTGSGKTEVYLQLLQSVLEEEKQAIVLVPEISLTPQLVRRFAERFGPLIAVYHSQLTEREKTNQWWEMVSGNKKILIGARSALFCPLPNLGLIVIDEEHEPSFKQEESLKYHARDAAIVLAKQLQIPVLLGSATPSLESWQNAKESKYHLHRLTQRVQGRLMPKVSILNLKGMDKSNKNLPFWLSQELKDKMSHRLSLRQQVALFLNRRGVANIVLCPGCGENIQCPNCSVGLTLHGRTHLICHYCDYDCRWPDLCPNCKQCELKAIGVGTELIEKDLAELFPEARIARADRDNISSREDLESLIDRMESSEIDILIGTQMIAKGLDFEKLTLVGMILADVGFNLPDFRACERSFQLFMQMGGRAGRHEAGGEVLIQAYNTKHPSLLFSLENDFEGFAEYEFKHRRELFYPPFGRLACVRIAGKNQEKTQQAAEVFAERARGLLMRPEFSGMDILGPAEAPLARIRNQFRFQLLIKGPKYQSLNQMCQILEDQDYPDVKIIFDIDPFNMI